MNPRFHVELPRLSRLRERLVQRKVARRPTCPALRRRQGSVLDAVTTALERAGRPLRVRDVHAATEEALGGPVPFSSVNEALSTHAQGDSALFRRVRYGVYEHRIVAGARGPRECGLTSSDDEDDRPGQSGNEGGES